MLTSFFYLEYYCYLSYLVVSTVVQRASRCGLWPRNHVFISLASCRGTIPISIEYCHCNRLIGCGYLNWSRCESARPSVLWLMKALSLSPVRSSTTTATQRNSYGPGIDRVPRCRGMSIAPTRAFFCQRFLVPVDDPTASRSPTGDPSWWRSDGVHGDSYVYY